MDEEMSLLLRKLGFAFIVALIFVLPVSLFVHNKFDNSTSNLLAKISSKDKILIFVTGNKCSECNDLENVLKSSNVKYYKINRDNDDMNFRIIMDKINMNKEFVSKPCLILVENGKLSVNINEFDDVDLDNFFNENNLIR